MVMPILACRDVAASLKFYVDQLGFRKLMEMPGHAGPDFAIVSFGSAVYFGLQHDRETTNRGQGMVLMLYLPDGMSVDEYADQVQAKGVRLAREVDDEYWGDRTFALFDPDGYCLMPAVTVNPLVAQAE